MWNNCIKSADAILVCNFEKNGILNYIGNNTLMETSFTHINNKIVFLLNPISKKVLYSDEIETMTGYYY